MSDIPPIGLPNLVSQGEQLARARAAGGAEGLGQDRTALERERAAVRRAAELARVPRVEAVGRRAEERKRGQAGHGRGHTWDEAPLDDGDDGEEHRLDVTA
jgi:hypothetical protein